jgi:hypothetical protein
MYTNGNFDSHLAAACFLGTMGLTFLLTLATVVLFFVRRRWAPYPLLAIAALFAGYAVVLGFFSWASYDRTVARGDQKFYCGLDCHIAYSVQSVDRMKTIGDATAQREFVVITLRAHFDERTIAPWRGNGALRPDPPTLELVDGSGRSYGVSDSGQRAWVGEHPPARTLTEPLRPGESYETTWVFDVPAGDASLRMFAGWHGFPSYMLIGDEDSPGHGKTYLALVQ